jgi:putative oxidoreductase
MLNRLIKFNFAPSYIDSGLLVLRVFTALSLFIKHGIEKVFTFQQMSGHFSDPWHIGSVPTLVIAMIADGIFSVFIMLGLATRYCCIYVWSVIFVAWSFRHEFSYLGKGTVGDHGELIILYLIAFTAIFLMGPGRYSLDALLMGKLVKEG